MKQLSTLKRRLKPGEVYRRADLQKWSTAVDRHLHQLVQEKALEKLSGGLYYAPRQTIVGKTPPDENKLVSAFLKDNRFVVISPNDYNGLGVGTTQLYNLRRVYNQKRHGTFKLGNRNYHFVRKPYVPDKVTREFLLVDLVNNIKHLAEDQPALHSKIKLKVGEMDKKKLKQLLHYFGTVGTRKQIASML